MCLQPAGNTIAFRSADPIPRLVENTCCRCLRRAYEYEAGSCDAVFEEDGYILEKCSNCLRDRSDCVSVTFSIAFAYDTHVKRGADFSKRCLFVEMSLNRPMIC